MRTVAATRKDVLRPDVTAEEYRQHMAKVKRWALANDEKYRPFAFAWGYKTNARTWACWAQLETIENEIVKHKTFHKGQRPSLDTHRRVRRDWRKAGILADERDYYGEDGRGRHGSGLKIGVTRYFNFNWVIRHGVAEDFDFHAPLDTESDMPPSEAVITTETMPPSDAPLLCPPPVPPSIKNYITNEIKNPIANSGQAREVAADGIEEVDRDGNASRSRAQRDTRAWDGIDLYPVLFWRKRNGSTGLATVDLAKDEGFYDRVSRHAREISVTGAEWQHARSLGDADRLAFLTGLADDDPDFRDVLEELYHQEVKEVEYARRREEAVSCIPKRPKMVWVGSKLQQAPLPPHPWETPEFKAAMAERAAERRERDPRIVIREPERRPLTADDVIRQLIPSMR